MRPLGFGYALVDWLASGETFAWGMPVGDAFFSQFPAEKNGAAFDFAGKIQQADVEVLYLHAHGIDFRHSVFYALNGFLTLGFATCDVHDIQVHAASKKNLVSGLLHLAVNRLNQLLAVNGGAQEGL